MRFRWVLLLLVCVLVVPAYSTTILNTIPSVGTITQVPAPVGSLPLSNTVVSIFQEKTLTLGADLGVDVLTSGAGPYSVLSAGNILTGTTVSSFYLHVDPLSTTVLDPVSNYTGTILFDSKILGLILMDNTLAGTDAMFNMGATTYNVPPLQGLELYGTIPDQFTVSGNSLAYNLNALQASDNIRILFASEIPEPSTALFVLPGLALVALGAIRRRRGEQK